MKKFISVDILKKAIAQHRRWFDNDYTAITEFEIVKVIDSESKEMVSVEDIKYLLDRANDLSLSDTQSYNYLSSNLRSTITPQPKKDTTISIKDIQKIIEDWHLNNNIVGNISVDEHYSMQGRRMKKALEALLDE